MANNVFDRSLVIGLSISILVAPLQVSANENHGGSAAAAVKNSGLLNQQNACFVVQDKSDQEKLVKLDQELMALNADLGSNPEELESQARKLIESSLSGMAPQTRVALNAQLLMKKTASTLIQIQSDPALSKELIAFQEALDLNHNSSQKLANAGKFTGSDMVPDVSFQAYRIYKLHSDQKEAVKAGDAVSEAHDRLFNAIQNSSSLTEEQKKQLRGNVTKIAQNSFGTSNKAADQFIDNVEVRYNISESVQSASVGGALTVLGAMFLGGTTSGATGVTALSGMARLGGIGMTILKGAVGGASLAGGTRLAVGGAANILRATYDHGEFFCNLAREQKENSALLYAEAASAAKTGAVFGGVFAGGALMGGAFVNGAGGTLGHELLLAGNIVLGAGSTAYGSVALLGMPINEGLRDVKTTKKLSEAIEATDTKTKMRLIEEAVGNERDHILRNKHFNEYIKPVLNSPESSDITPRQSKAINEILNTIIVGYAEQDANANNYENEGNMGGGTMISAAPTMILESTRIELAGKRIRRILGEE